MLTAGWAIKSACTHIQDGVVSPEGLRGIQEAFKAAPANDDPEVILFRFSSGLAGLVSMRASKV